MGPLEASPSRVDSRQWWVCDELILLQLWEQDTFRWSISHLGPHPTKWKHEHLPCAA